MLIKKMKLKNYKPFRGETEIVFSTDNIKNTTVILGNNSAGKTTIIGAFLWCLYGRLEKNEDELELFNYELRSELAEGGVGELYVEIEIKHEKHLYTIKRTLEYIKERNGLDIYFKKRAIASLKMYAKTEDGETHEIYKDLCEETINKILPKDLAEYFFIKREKVLAITKSKDLKSAVNGLLKINVIENARNHLNPKHKNSATRRLEEMLSEEADEKYKELFKKRNDVLEQILEIKKIIEDFKSQKIKFEQEKEKVKDEIKGNKDTKALQDDGKKQKESLDKIETELQQLEKTATNVYQDNLYKYFALPLYAKAYQALNKVNTQTAGIPSMSEPAIDHILERGYCICGCALNNNEEATSKIKQEKTLLGNMKVVAYKKQCVDFEKFAKDLYEKIESFYTQYRALSRDFENEESRLNAIEERLKGNQDVSKLKAKLEEIEENISNLEEKNDIYNQKLGIKNKELDDTKKELEKNGKKLELNKHTRELILYANALYEIFDSKFSRAEQEVRENLEKAMNKYFKAMYHGNADQYVISIDEEYKIIDEICVNGQKYPAGMSDGTEGVKSFSFIAALVELANMKAEKEDKNECSPYTVERYPVVMDAPFSNEDEVHIQKIAQTIPQVADQVIILVMEKDWEYAKKVLNENVGRIYKITKKRETMREIKEMENI